MKGWLLIETLPALLLAEAVPKMNARYASIVVAMGWL